MHGSARNTISFFFLFKQKTAYEVRISDWSSDVFSSDLEQLCTRRVNRYPACTFGAQEGRQCLHVRAQQIVADAIAPVGSKADCCLVGQTPIEIGRAHV